MPNATLRPALAALLLALPSAAAEAPAPPDPLEAAVAPLVKIASAREPSISPDGQRIAFVSNASGQPQAWVVSAAGGTPVRLTEIADPVGAVEWSPDGSRIAYTVAPGGGMNTQVWVVGPDGKGARRLTDGGTETNRLGPFREDGKVLAVASNRRYRARIEGWLCDLASGALTLVAEARGSGAILDIARDGKTVLVQKTPQRGSSSLYLLDVASKKETPLTPHEDPGTVTGVLSPDGKTVWVSTNIGREMTAFGRIELGTSPPSGVEILAAREDAELAGFRMNRAGTEAALLWNVAGRSELAFLDVKKKALRKGPPLPGEVAGGMSFSKDGSKLALAVGGSKMPGDIWLLDVGSGRLARVTDSPHEGIDLGTLVAPELVKIPSWDARLLWSWLYRPRGAAGPGPLVLSFHGGPEAQETPAFRPEYQALLARGISVLAPNVRGSSGFGRTFVNLDNQRKRIGVLRDVKACLDWAVSEKIADPARVGIMGGSYGGWVTMAALTAYPDSFAAGVDLYGIVNFRTFFENTEPWMAAISKAEYGDPETQADLLKELSPVFKLGWLKAPVLVLHGRNDTNVPLGEATQLVDRLKERNVPVELIVFPDEGHGFRKLPNRIRADAALVGWFEKYLKPVSPASESR